MAAEAREQIDRQTAVEVLSERRRQFVVHALEKRDAPTSLETLTRQVAAWESGTSPHAVTDEHRLRVSSTLQRIHIPALAEAGIVSVDDENGTVELTDAARGLTGQDSWSAYYLTLGVVSIGLVSGLWIGVPPFDLVSPLIAALVLRRGDHVHGTSASPPRTASPVRLATGGAQGFQSAWSMISTGPAVSTESRVTAICSPSPAAVSVSSSDSTGR